MRSIPPERKQLYWRIGFVTARALVKYAKELNTALAVDDRRKEDEFYLKEMEKVIECVEQARRIHRLTVDANEEDGAYDDDEDDLDKIDSAYDLGERIENRDLPNYEALRLFRRIELHLKVIDNREAPDRGQR